MIEKLLNYGDNYHIENIEKVDNKNLIYIKSKTTNCKCRKCKILSNEKHSTYRQP